MTAARTSTYRRPATAEARERANAYRRRYRKEHPEAVKRWRDGYILRRAARLQAAAISSGQDDTNDAQDTKGGDG